MTDVLNTPAPVAEPDDRTLTIDRLIDAPRAALFRCWTDPELMKQWFAPKPVEITRVETDLRPGGSSRVTMRLPDGDEIDCPGVYLEVVPDEKIVFTDAFTAGWAPSGRPFMVAEITFADDGGKTRYVARARHWSAETCAEHKAMGFYDGWGRCADQLEALARTL